MLQDTKKCSKCKVVKPRTAFAKCSRYKHGMQPYCKSCKSIWNKEKYNTDPEWKETKLSYNKNWARENPEIVLNYVRNRRAKEPEKYKALTNKRRKLLRKAQPKWANKFFLEEIYILALLRTKVTGISWHVDHIIPLTHPLVCGLHCEDNLQVIPAILNLQKNNSFSIE